MDGLFSIGSDYDAVFLAVFNTPCNLPDETMQTMQGKKALQLEKKKRKTAITSVNLSHS